jgi:hypothetical protein
MSTSVPCGSQQSIVEDSSRDAVERAPKRPRGGGLRGSQIEGFSRAAVVREAVDIKSIKNIKNMCRHPVAARLVPGELVPIEEQDLGVRERLSDRDSGGASRWTRAHDRY